MASMLKATLIGFLAGNPEKIEYNNGTSVCSFTVAVNKKERNKDGELIDNVVWVNVKARGKNAENLLNFATKGTQIYIEGTPYASAYMSKKSAGVAVAQFNVNLSNFTLLGSRPKDDSSNVTSQKRTTDASKGVATMDEDVPF